MMLTATRNTLLTSLCLCAVWAVPALSADAPAPGGLFVGYYQEDPVNNPEDPTPGAFVLNLPDKDSPFAGNMYFTYVGCQNSNVGEVKGTKSGYALSGTWSGTIDNSPQAGPYRGTYDPAAGSYKGIYSNSQGKQFKDIPGCIQYYIAANGSWEMFPVEQNKPATFSMAVSAATASWSAVPGAALTLIYLIDPLVAQTGNGNPIKWQTVVPGAAATLELRSAGLAKGKEYIVVALVGNMKAQRVAFGSKRFTAT
jgi:hypothetical protein